MIQAILAVSISAILFLFWLIYGRTASTGLDVSFLAGANALFNSISTLCILLGIQAIRKGKKQRHKRYMLSALLASTLFLISYIVYHTFHGDVRFMGQGIIRPIYFFILISHILLSVMALPMILITVAFAFTERFTIHKKIAKFTFPIWLYISVTGVIIYLLIKIYTP